MSVLVEGCSEESCCQTWMSVLVGGALERTVVGSRICFLLRAVFKITAARAGNSSKGESQSMPKAVQKVPLAG